MRITEPEFTNKQIIEYMETGRMNSLIRTGIAAPFKGYVFEEKELLKCAAQLKKDFEEEGMDFTEDESVIAMMVIDLLMDTLEIEDDQIPVPDKIMEEVIREGRVFHEGAFEDNPYYTNIHFDDQRKGMFRLTKGSFEKYETIHYDTPAKMADGILIPRVGTFDHNFEFPCIMEGGTIWMSVTPNEICTMESHILRAHGDVLTLGCGMGYYAYMASLKDDVKTVTIVEREQNVIELFEEYILPQFEHKEKIRLVKADAIEYMEKLEDGQFDVCFADIWKGNNDLTAYLTLKRICARFKNTKITYWIEDTLLSTISSYVYMLIVEALCAAQMIEPPVLPKNDYALDYIRRILKDAVIETPEDVDKYMKPENILSLLENLPENSLE